MQKRQLLLPALVLLVLLAARQTSAIPVSAEAEISDTPRYAALTFDDGPHRDTTSRLLDGLRQRGIHATFFLVGEMIVGNEDLVQRMAAEGHQVGNHSWSHVSLQGKDQRTVDDEIGRTDSLLSDLLGERDYWVRPPYGLLNPEQQAWFSVPLVHWTVDPEDWKLRNTAKDVQAILQAVQPGDIILLHDTIPESVEAALQTADALLAQGYTLVTVEELLERTGTEPEAGVFYRSATLRCA